MKSKLFILLALFIPAIAGAQAHTCAVGGRCIQATDIYHGSPGSWIDFYLPASTPTAQTACYFDSNGAPASSITTATELSYLHGATSNLQTQINDIVGQSGITGLSGDGTAGAGSGPGVVALTLATVNSSPGSYPKVTVNGKGLVTSGTTLSSGDIPNNAANTSGSAGSFTGSLAGDVTGTQGATAIAATTVTGKVLTGYSSTTGTITSADSVLTAIEKLNGNTPSAGISALTGDVTASGSGSVAATVAFVGGSSAANVHTSQLATAAATSADTALTIVARDGSSGFGVTKIYDSAGATSILASARELMTSAGKIVMKWNTLTLQDTGASGGGITWDTGNKDLYDDSGVQALDWTNRYFFDSSDNIAITFGGQLRQLESANGSSQLEWNNSGVFLPGLTASTPLYLSAGNIISSGTFSGNTTEFATATGALTSGHCVQIDASGNFVDAGSACGGGGGGSGTVTSVSVASANGFAGTVATSTTTPAITLSTTITGITKGNGTALSAATSGTDYSAGTSGLSTGILKSTTSTGALTIAVASDFPTLNQNTTGTAANVTGTSNSTLTTLSSLSLPGSQVSGDISGNAANVNGTSNSTLTTLSSLSLPGSQVSGDISGNAANVNGTSNSTLTTLSALSSIDSGVTANYFMASPNGSTGAMTPRAIVAADVPTLNQNTSGSAASLSQSLTSNLPVIGNGTGVTTGTRSGNTTSFATTSGTLTSGHCVDIDASGNLIDAGAACGSGGSGITALTGDVTASGTGSVAATLAATTNGTLTTLSALTQIGATSNQNTFSNPVVENFPAATATPGLTVTGTTVGGTGSIISSLFSPTFAPSPTPSATPSPSLKFYTVAIEPTINVSPTPTVCTSTDLFINETDTHVCTGTGSVNYLINAEAGSSSKFSVDNAGDVAWAKQMSSTFGGSVSTLYLNSAPTSTPPLLAISDIATGSQTWNSNGTFLGVNAASSDGQELIDLLTNNSSVFRCGSTGGCQFEANIVIGGASTGIYQNTSNGTLKLQTTSETHNNDTSHVIIDTQTDQSRNGSVAATLFNPTFAPSPIPSATPSPSLNFYTVAIEPTINVSPTPTVCTTADLFINETDTSQCAGTGSAGYLIEALAGGTQEFTVTNTGNLSANGTALTMANIASVTPGTNGAACWSSSGVLGTDSANCIASLAEYKEAIERMDGREALTLIYHFGEIASYYKYRDDYLGRSKDLPHAKDQQPGFIAEEVEKIDPRYAAYNGDKLRGVKYEQMVAVEAAAIKQLTDDVTELKRQLTELRAGAVPHPAPNGE